MSASARKFIGMTFLFLCLGLYTLVVVYTAVEYLPDHWAIELVYYAVFGVAWAFPTKYLMVWMHKPDAHKDEI